MVLKRITISFMEK